MNHNWIDISVTIQSGMVHWPDNPEIRVERMMDMSRGDICNVSTLAMGSHTGTHMDGPVHFIRDGLGLDRMPIDATVGPARVLEIKDAEAVKVKELESQNISAGERILLKTRNSSRDWANAPFDEDFVYISQEAARFLADRKIQTIGVDYLSVGGFRRDGVETHQALLSAGIWVIEGLNLSQVAPGKYELVCLPIKVLDSDGAPARAVLRAVGS